MMEQGKSLSRKIAITLSEPWSFIRQIQVLETKQTEGAHAAWSRLLLQKAENPDFQSCAFLPSFSAFQVVCPDHRGHSPAFEGKWAGSDGALRLLGLIPSLPLSKEPKEFWWILVQASDLSLSQYNHPGQATYTGKQEDSTSADWSR